MTWCQNIVKENRTVEEQHLDEAGKINYHTLKPVLFEFPTYEYLKTGEVIGKYFNLPAEAGQTLTLDLGSGEKPYTVTGILEKENNSRIFTVWIAESAVDTGIHPAPYELRFRFAESQIMDPVGMKQIRNLFQMLSTEYGMTFLISSHLLSEIESIADTIGVISHGKLIKEISMKEILEMNTAFIELMVENTQKAAYILSDKLNLNHFKVMDDSRIRIYEASASTQKNRIVYRHGISHFYKCHAGILYCECL